MGAPGGGFFPPTHKKKKKKKRPPSVGHRTWLRHSTEDKSISSRRSVSLEAAITNPESVSSVCACTYTAHVEVVREVPRLGSPFVDSTEKNGLLRRVTAPSRRVTDESEFTFCAPLSSGNSSKKQPAHILNIRSFAIF